MTMFDPLRVGNSKQTELPLTLSVGAFPAKTSAMPAEALVLQVSGAVYGSIMPVLLARYDRSSSSWKTSERCFIEGWMPFLEAWPRSGMMLSGTAYQLPTLAHTTDATGSGLLPTPRAIDGRSAGTGTKDATITRRAASSFGLNLAETVQAQVRGLWPTPNANDNRDRGNLSSPCVQRRARIGKQLMLSQVVSDQSGALNPPWVEWLMGFPDGWTDLSSSETP
jgi:hypothetical protein